MEVSKKFYTVSEVALKKKLSVDDTITIAIQNKIPLYVYVLDAKFEFRLTGGDFEYSEIYKGNYLTANINAICHCQHYSPDKKLKIPYLNPTCEEKNLPYSCWTQHPPELALENLLVSYNDLELFTPIFDEEENFRKIIFHGKSYRIKEKQACVIRHLFKKYKEGCPQQTNGDIVSSLDVTIRDNKIHKEFPPTHPLRKANFLIVDTSNPKQFLYSINITPPRPHWPPFAP